MKGNVTVPTGEYWIVRVVMKGEVRVSGGAKLTILETLMKGKIVVEVGGEFDLQGVNMKGEILYEKSPIAMQEENLYDDSDVVDHPRSFQFTKNCASCGAKAGVDYNFCTNCGQKF